MQNVKWFQSKKAKLDHQFIPTTIDDMLHYAYYSNERRELKLKEDLLRSKLTG